MLHHRPGCSRTPRCEPHPPWASDAKLRMNPRNRLCLNALNDRAFDRRLMFFDQGLRVCFTRKFEPKPRDDGLKWLLNSQGQAIRLPRKFQPDLLLSKANAA